MRSCFPSVVWLKGTKAPTLPFQFEQNLENPFDPPLTGLLFKPKDSTQPVCYCKSGTSTLKLIHGISDVTTQPHGFDCWVSPTELVIAVVEVATSSAVVGASTMSAASYYNHQHPSCSARSIWIFWSSSLHETFGLDLITNSISKPSLCLKNVWVLTSSTNIVIGDSRITSNFLLLCLDVSCVGSCVELLKAHALCEYFVTQSIRHLVSPWGLSNSNCGMQGEYCLTTELIPLLALVVSIRVRWGKRSSPTGPRFQWIQQVFSHTSKLRESGTPWEPNPTPSVAGKPHSGVIDTKPAIVLVSPTAFWRKKTLNCFLQIWDYVKKNALQRCLEVST